MGSTPQGVVVDPISSTDGRPVDVVPDQGRNAAKTIDERQIELLQGINAKLDVIVRLLSMEFEQDLDDSEAVGDITDG